MEATVIDTLRYADRLKAAGVGPQQAEAMSRALNKEFAGGVATKKDLDGAVLELKGEIATVDAKVDLLEAKCEAGFDAIDTKLAAVDAKFDARFEAIDTRFEAIDTRFEAMDKKFEAKFKAIGAQTRYVFLVLALITALGLYNAVAPHLYAKIGQAVAGSAPSGVDGDGASRDIS